MAVLTTASEGVDARISAATSIAYWGNIDADVNGMLGGYPQVSRTDLIGSANFFAKLRKSSQSTSSTRKKVLSRGVDCGAGIGRITAGFLSKVCEVVDVVEPVEKFAIKVKDQELKGNGVVGDVYVTGLEDWTPERAQYDLIWNQWCLGHLNDQQLVAYLQRCANALQQGGWVVVKENLCTGMTEDVFDDEDSSVTRRDESFRALFEKAEMKIVRTELQTGFPKELYPVRLYALQPKQWPEE